MDLVAPCICQAVGQTISSLLKPSQARAGAEERGLAVQGGGGARTVVQGACWGKGGVGGTKGGTTRSMWCFEWIREEDITDKKRKGEGEIVKDITRQYIIGGLYG